MKKLALILSFLSLILLSAISNAEEMPLSDSLYEEIKKDVIHPFFKSLKDGDINAIKSHLSSAIYNEYKRLLEENKDYPQFLRDYYQDAKFRTERAKEIDGDVVVDVVIEFPNGSRIQNILRLSEEKGKFKVKPKSYMEDK
jgi:ABC-type transporter MlaC component